MPRSARVGYRAVVSAHELFRIIPEASGYRHLGGGQQQGLPAVRGRWAALPDGPGWGLHTIRTRSSDLRIDTPRRSIASRTWTPSPTTTTTTTTSPTHIPTPNHRDYQRAFSRPDWGSTDQCIDKVSLMEPAWSETALWDDTRDDTVFDTRRALKPTISNPHL